MINLLNFKHTYEWSISPSETFWRKQDIFRITGFRISATVKAMQQYIMVDEGSIALRTQEILASTQ